MDPGSDMYIAFGLRSYPVVTEWIDSYQQNAPPPDPGPPGDYLGDSDGGDTSSNGNTTKVVLTYGRCLPAILAQMYSGTPFDWAIIVMRKNGMVGSTVTYSNAAIDSCTLAGYQPVVVFDWDTVRADAPTLMAAQRPHHVPRFSALIYRPQSAAIRQRR